MNTNTLEELLSCPFCGDDDILVYAHDSDRSNSTWWSVSCGECSAEVTEDTRGAVIVAWNRRKA